MNPKRWTASAPANIAIIKYMGKSDVASNQGANPSLSLTLEDLRTHVELELLAGGPHDLWEPLHPELRLDHKGQKRYLDFLAKIKGLYGVTQNFSVRSGNNFPSDAGIASSASSFAALTKVAAAACAELSDRPSLSNLDLARLSRTGSGSSCRSFFSPWCAWDGHEQIQSVPSTLGPLKDYVLSVESGKKRVSSSEAHLKVQYSPLFSGRAERANSRQKQALNALEAGDWQKLCEIAWTEFWDMHSLFHTSQPSFFYFKPATLRILEWVEQTWESQGFGPLATIDAGPNVHLLLRTAEEERFAPQIQALAKETNAHLYIST